MWHPYGRGMSPRSFRFRILATWACFGLIALVFYMRLLTRGSGVVSPLLISSLCVAVMIIRGRGPKFPRLPKWADKTIYGMVTTIILALVAVQVLEIPINWTFVRGCIAVVVLAVFASAALCDFRLLEGMRTPGRERW